MCHREENRSVATDAAVATYVRWGPNGIYNKPLHRIIKIPIKCLAKAQRKKRSIHLVRTKKNR